MLKHVSVFHFSKNDWIVLHCIDLHWFSSSCYWFGQMVKGLGRKGLGAWWQGDLKKSPAMDSERTQIISVFLVDTCLWGPSSAEKALDIICTEDERQTRLPYSLTTGGQEPKGGAGRGPPTMPHISSNSAHISELWRLEGGFSGWGGVGERKTPSGRTSVALWCGRWACHLNLGLLIPTNQSQLGWWSPNTKEKVSHCFTLRLRAGRTMLRTQRLLPRARACLYSY